MARLRNTGGGGGGEGGEGVADPDLSIFFLIDVFLIAFLRFQVPVPIMQEDLC